MNRTFVLESLVMNCKKEKSKNYIAMVEEFGSLEHLTKLLNSQLPDTVQNNRIAKP